jgi:hypothetical protein
LLHTEEITGADEGRLHREDLDEGVNGEPRIGHTAQNS